MNFLDRALARIGLKRAIDNPPQFLSAYAGANELWQPDQYATMTQQQIYSRVSWVWSAVNMVASVCATTKLDVEKRQDDGNEAITNHPLEDLLREPNPIQSRFEFFYATMAWYLITGNCYWWLNRANETATPDEIWIIPSHQIRPVPSRRTFIHGYMYDAGDGVEIPIEPHEIAHFKSFNPENQYIGMSLLETLENTAIHDHAATKWNRNFFAKDNAKPSGGLFFSSPIGKEQWEETKRIISDEYGGTNRRLLLLQGVGEGAVNFVPMMLSQSDMEFIESRKFNRDEIFNAVAVGSAAMVDVNATEANSKTGKDVFFSIGVYPRLNLIAQKITSEILPSYGDNLICEFEDVRQKDVQLEMLQITEYSRYHTVEEVRRKWYGDDPLGDDRDELFAAEIANKQPEPEEKDEPQPEPENDQPDIEEQVKAVLDSALDKLHNRIESAIKSIPQQPVLPATTTVTINQSSPEIEAEVIKAETVEPSPAENDLQLWEKKARNRANKGRSITVPFESDHIPEAIKAFVSANLDQEDIDTTFGVAKAMLLQLDPDDDEAEQKARITLENDSTDAIEKALGQDFEKFQRMIETGRADASEIERILSEMEADSATKDTIRRMLIQSTDLGVSVALQQLDNVGIAFDWTLANADARDWANQYVGELITGINATTRRRVQQSVSEWVNNGEPLSALVDELSSTFGRQRAEMIASTEVTKAYYQGSVQGYQQSGVVEAVEWRTANDEKVCVQCGPLLGERTILNSQFSHPTTNKEYLPPAHPRCRCWVAPILID